MGKDIRSIIDEQIGRAQILRQAAMDQLIESEPTELHRSVITISRQLGAEGHQVGQRLADRLGWTLWDRELVDAIAKDADISRRIVEVFDEKTVSEFDIIAREAISDIRAGGFLYHRHLAHALLAIASHGNVIIIGRGSNFLLPYALNVRLVASEKYRIERVMVDGGLPRDEAIHRIHKSDRERSAFIHSTYQRDVNDPLAYDVVIKIDEIGAEGAVEVILTALRFKKDMKDSPKY